MLYRLCQPDDFAALYAIEEACFQPPLRFPRGYMRSLVTSHNSATWIAGDDGRMAGFAIVEWDESEEGTLAYIQTLEVSAEQRKKGVGAELLRRMEESARAAGAGIIWLHVDEENAPAIHLYQTHDYEFRGREENYYARRRAALVYVKSLAAAPSSDH